MSPSDDPKRVLVPLWRPGGPPADTEPRYEVDAQDGGIEVWGEEVVDGEVAVAVAGGEDGWLGRVPCCAVRDGFDWDGEERFHDVWAGGGVEEAGCWGCYC